MKVVIVIALLGILIALGSAGALMLRRGRREQDGEAQPEQVDKHMARALAVRVGISVALFALVLLAWAMGWVRPTGLPLAG